MGKQLCVEASMSGTVTSSTRLAEQGAVLLGHTDERRSPAQLFELGGPHIGTGRPQSPENIQDRVFYIPFVRHFHSLALRGSVFGYPSHVLLHRRFGAHAVEELELLPVPLDQLSSTLSVARKHPSQHDKIRSASKGFGDISWARAASVRDDVPLQAMGRVSALDHGTQLGVPHPCLSAGSAHGTIMVCSGNLARTSFTNSTKCSE